MRILLVATAFNSLTQRVFAELGDRGHLVGVELALGDEELRAAVHRHDPGLIIAPMLRTAIPRDLWSTRTCLIVHPGPVGDRGPSSLDWAVQEGEAEWGVTVLQAEAEMDAGPVWAWQPCRLPPAGKSDLYRNEISDAACAAVLLAVDRFAGGEHVPLPQTPRNLPHGVRVRPRVIQSDRRIDWWTDSTETVVRTLRAADSQPGVLDELLGGEWFLHGGHEERRLRGRPGRLLATRAEAVCRATTDGAVWIPRLRPRRTPDGPATFALPATTALGDLLPAAARGARAGRPARAVGFLERHPLPRGGRGRVPVVLLPRRRDEHRAVPPAAARLPDRVLPADVGAGAGRAAGLLLQRHPSPRDRGRRRPGRRVLGEHQRHGRPGGGGADHHRPAGGRRARRQRRGRRCHAGPRRRRGVGAGTARCSTRTTA